MENRSHDVNLPRSALTHPAPIGGSPGEAVYRTCIFCHKHFGSNRVVEAFPVWRRLAFDAAKGRLWVVCGKCRCWNLTPLEERWEAVEECERLYRGTRMRASTGNIGIARHAEGLELVRTGKPQRPEFAAWRYGDHLNERRRHAIVTTVAAVGGGLAMFPVLAALPPLVPGIAVSGLGLPCLVWAYRHTIAKVHLGESAARASVSPEDVARFRLMDLQTVRLLPDDREPGFFVQIRWRNRTARFRGEDARRVAGTIRSPLGLVGVHARNRSSCRRHDRVASSPPPIPRGSRLRKARRPKETAGARQEHAQACQARPRDGSARRTGAACPGGRTLGAGAGVEGSRRDRRNFGQPPAPRENRRVLRAARTGDVSPGRTGVPPRALPLH